MKIPTVFAVFVVLLVVVTAQDLGEVYCGRRLASALAFMCEGNLIKRSEAHHKMMDVDYDWDLDLDRRGPWIGAQRAHSMGRSKRQVVAECCEKPCTVSELMTYCGI